LLSPERQIGSSSARLLCGLRWFWVEEPASLSSNLCNMRSSVLALVFISLIFVGSACAGDWTTRQDGRFGFSYSYPAELFAEIEGERPSFHYFQSPGTQAKFLVGAWDNERGETPSEFKQWMLTHADGYQDITYRPRGRSWFVLSGHRGDQIYYEKTIFSCGGRIVNVPGNCVSRGPT
jgi:hypothetical protein